MDDTIKIGVDLKFKCQVDSAAVAAKALEVYRQGRVNANEWLKESSDMPIFFDTNVLLNIYDISKTERESFIKFLEKNKDRIYISSQVQREFLRHRVLQIRGVQSRIMTIKTEILTIIDSIVNDYKKLEGGIKGVAFRNVVKYGMPEVYSSLKSILDLMYSDDVKKVQEQIAANVNGIRSVIDSECDSFKSILSYEYDDPLLTAIQQLNVIPSLSDDEINLIKGMYKCLKTAFDAIESGWSKERLTFPGSGDKDKPIDGAIEESVAWGDLHIYLEMLRFMKKNQTDVLFITRDVSKGDWLKKENNQPFTHYIENAYEQTSKMLFIKNADEYLPLVTEGMKVIDAEDSDDIGEIGTTDDIPMPDIVDVVDIEESGGEVNASEQNEDRSILIGDLKHQFTKKFRPITTTEFMAELTICDDWAKSYGAGYISKSYFIFDILGQKKYDFTSCLDALDELVKDKKIKVITERHDDHEMECIELL